MVDLELVIATGNFSRNMLNLGMEKFSKKLDYTYEISFAAEESLVEEAPTNAVVYMHGDNMQDNKNLELIPRLADMRPDLRIIMRLEKGLVRRLFKSDESFDLYQRLKQEHNKMFEDGYAEFDEKFPDPTEDDDDNQFIRFDPSKFIIGSFNNPVPFFAKESFYRDFEGNSEPNFDNYMQQWFAQPKLDFVVVYDEGKRGYEDAVGQMLFGELSQEYGFRYNFDWKTEDTFANPDEFPEGAIVLTHSSYNKDNRNLASICSLAEQRQDLRFLIRTEPGQNVGAMQSFYREIMTADFSPTSRAVAIGDSPVALTGARTMNDKSYLSFKDYVQELVEMRK
ncbi:hypothetical protein HOC35_01195 [Candidatus Woesearchaeota archaeon]|nr:hypothetical protein [Candidatus Woesearchaeota archaeon]